MPNYLKFLQTWVIAAGFFLMAGCQVFHTLPDADKSQSVEKMPVEVQNQKYVQPLPDFNPMQFAWFYKPPESTKTLLQLASNYSLFIFTRNDEAERDQLVESGAQGDTLQYLRFDAIMDPGDCQTKPFQNQAANLEGDFCQISAHHPDWFLGDINNTPVKFFDSGYYVMDPGTSGWQDFFQERISGFQEDQGWQGIFLDNVDASLGRFNAMGLQLTRYQDSKSFQDKVASHLARLSMELRDKQHKTIFANITFLRDPETWFRYLTYLDGAMLEAFAADWDNGYLSESDWLAQMDIAETTQAEGKRIILVTQGEPDDLLRMRFGLASFLLVNNGQAYFRYSNDQAYRQDWWFPEFDHDLGQPLGPRYNTGDVWRRDFEGGYVSVDLVNNYGEIVPN